MHKVMTDERTTNKKQENQEETWCCQVERGSGTGAGGLALDEGDLHVLNLDAHQEEVDLPDHHVLQVVPAQGTHQHQRHNIIR